jgi:hypothetical protein
MGMATQVIDTKFQKTYPSIKAAVRATGLHSTTITESMTYAGGRFKRGDQTPDSRRPVVIDGRPFETIRAAMRATRIPYSTLRWRLTRKKKRPRKGPPVLDANTIAGALAIGKATGRERRALTRGPDQRVLFWDADPRSLEEDAA